MKDSKTNKKWGQSNDILNLKRPQTSLLLLFWNPHHSKRSRLQQQLCQFVFQAGHWPEREASSLQSWSSIRKGKDSIKIQQWQFTCQNISSTAIYTILSICIMWNLKKYLAGTYILVRSDHQKYLPDINLFSTSCHTVSAIRGTSHRCYLSRTNKFGLN